MERLQEISGWITDLARFRHAVISGRRRNFQPPHLRIDIRPIEIKGVAQLQLISHGSTQDLTKNVSLSNFDLDSIMAEGYGNITIELEDELIQVRATKKGELLIHRKRSEVDVEKSIVLDLSHDRKKDRLLPANDPIFKKLGISDEHGVLIPRKSDKYLQVDSFLRVIDSTRDKFSELANIKVHDLGCGSAYLTFAAQRFLETRGINAALTGVDSREDSRIRNEEIARSLGTEIKFVASQIAMYPIEPADLVIALHACDTATDDALAWAVKSGASVILAAPCCHHELNKSLKAASDEWKILIRDGILKERFADLITDSLRAQILRFLGYRTEIIEFVSDQHTPRNLMLRAIKNEASAKPDEIAAFLKFCHEWQIRPKLVEALANELPSQLVAQLG